MRTFWPVSDSAQADYELLREAALSGVVLATPAASLFARSGLAGLIAAPVAEPELVARLHASRRPAWHPYLDPRLEALGAAYELVLRVPTSLRKSEAR